MPVPHTSRLVAALAAVVAVGAVGCAAPSTRAGTAEEYVPSLVGSSSDCLPVSLSRNGRKAVFAHYFPPFPLSLDNEPASGDYYTREYLNPQGEGGKYAASGGYLRDRPPARPQQSGDWKLADARAEVRQAAAVGIDGFAVDILDLNDRHWSTLQRMLQAAPTVSGFRIMLQPDMVALRTTTPDQLASRLDSVAGHPAVARTSEGRLLVSPFHAEAKDTGWWKQFLAAMSAKGHDVALLPLVLDADASMDGFAPISFGLGRWGTRSPESIVKTQNFASRARSRGLRWMAPISVQDQRPAAGTYWESRNTETLVASWRKAVRDSANLALVVTWNDYGENSGFAPSANHGNAFLDLNAWGVEWFRSGAEPRIRKDTLILSHRTHRTTTKPTGQSRLMQARNATRDSVELVTLLTGPASVTVTVGSKTHTYQAPAGMSARLFPMSDGRVSANATRGGATVAKVATAEPITSAVSTQDLSYHAATSGCLVAGQAEQASSRTSTENSADASASPSGTATPAPFCECVPLPRPGKK